MKKIIFGLVVLCLLLTAGTAKAVLTLKEKGDWDEWWSLDTENYPTFNHIRRIYDKENNLVCWIVSGNKGVAIDCQPSKLLSE